MGGDLRPERPAERQTASAVHLSPLRDEVFAGRNESGGPEAKRRVAACRGGPRRERRPHRATREKPAKTMSPVARVATVGPEVLFFHIVFYTVVTVTLLGEIAAAATTTLPSGGACHTSGRLSNGCRG